MASADELFSRERLVGYDPELLGASAALVVGAGALGQNTAQNLALAGLGEIRIIDRDTFEEHNRTRSPAYPLPEERDLYGMEKARAVALKLRRIMTAPRPTMRYAHEWVQGLGDGAFEGASVVVSCVDSPLARAYLSDKSRQRGLPFVEGGFEGANVTLTSFPGVKGEEAWTTPCWRCSHQDIRGTFSCRFYAARAEAAGVIPAMQNAAAVLAGLQAEAAILSLHPDSPTTREARAFDLNIRTGQSRIVMLSKDPRCPGAHHSHESDPEPLRATADSTAGQLLEELTERLGETARVIFERRVFAGLVWRAPCTRCRRQADVRAPEWRWRISPRCDECGGDFPLVLGDTAAAPILYRELTPRSNPEVLATSCQQIGLPPLSLVRASGVEGVTTLFQLAGSLQEIYQAGETI
ncbi:MAG TPA: ThiF family adenylyltransferase [Pyrinomonadaceae bacterium]|nr:ThiF family adenylyltransferase [Pyrinomonadaceae bacterium]